MANKHRKIHSCRLTHGQRLNLNKIRYHFSASSLTKIKKLVIASSTKSTLPAVCETLFWYFLVAFTIMYQNNCHDQKFNTHAFK